METRAVVSGTRINCCIAIIVAALCFGLGTGKNVFAENKGPCADDVAKFCKDVKPGEGNIAKCLKEHAAELSPGCKDSIVEAKQKIQEFTEVCGNDLKKFCKDVKPGEGRGLKCLKEHEQELSPACKAKMSSPR
jgi:hypothetical protein